LLVRPPDDRLTRAAKLRSHTPLDGPEATPARLRATLASRRHQQLRIDCHGTYDEETGRSWLRLAPAGPAGALDPDAVRDMDLRGCGSVVLGACQSGMARRVGRDEPVGFVRAALHAGAATVVAARWVAEDEAAAAVLNRFDRYLRYLPRDVALQQAQLDVCTSVPGTPTNVADLDHPARWACWTLYGDPGWQTAVGPVRRFVRRHIDQWRLRDEQR
jgi:CHAT domain-containing protein